MKKQVLAMAVTAVLSAYALAGCGEDMISQVSDVTGMDVQSTVDAATDAAGKVKETIDAAAEQKDEISAKVQELSEVAGEYKALAEKYTTAANKLASCFTVDGSDQEGELWSQFSGYADAIKNGEMSDSDKTKLDGLIAEIDNLYAQSKNLCDTKLNDIIALSQGDYSGTFEKRMQTEREQYDSLIEQGKYQDAYKQLLWMESLYKEEAE